MKKKAFRQELNSQFWLNNGFNHEQLGEHQAAIESYMQGITLAPERPDGYLLCAKAYMSMEDFDEALKACDVGITYAQEHTQAPWANKLIAELEAGKTQISQEFTKSEYGTFSS